MPDLKDCPVGSVKSSVSSDLGTPRDCHDCDDAVAEALVHIRERSLALAGHLYT